MSFRLPGNFPRPMVWILLLGFFLRVWGLNFGLPHLYHADEPIVVNHALAYSGGDFNPHFFRLPPLVSYLLFFVYGLIYVAAQTAGIFQTPRDFEILFFVDPSFFYLAARFLFGVVPGTLSIAVLWFCVKRFFNERTALLSAFMFSVSFLHVRDSHYIYVDIPLILVMILSFMPLLLLIEKNSLKNHLKAGAMIGLAAAVKYNGLFLLFPFLLASLVGRPSGRPWHMQFIFWSAAGALCCGVFILLNPYALLDWHFFMQEIASESRARAAGTGLFHHLTYSLMGALGLPYLILAFIGMFASFRFMTDSRTKARWVFAGFVVFYYVILVRAGQPYDRYVLPLLPFMAFFAADAVVRLCGSFPRPRAAFIVLIGFAVSIPLAKSILLNRVLSAKDIRTEAKEWIESNISPGSKIALDTKLYMPPLSFSSEALERKRESYQSDRRFSEAQSRRLEVLIRNDQNKRRGYDLHFLHQEPLPADSHLLWGPFLPFRLESLKEAGIEYVILADSKNLKETSSDLREIKAFSPYKENKNTEPYDQQALTGAPFLWKELWNRNRNGQPVVFYELAGRDAPG